MAEYLPVGDISGVPERKSMTSCMVGPAVTYFFFLDGLHEYDSERSSHISCRSESAFRVSPEYASPMFVLL